MNWESYKDASKRNFGDAEHKQWASLNFGIAQRVADALEKIANPYLSLIEEVKRYKQWYEEELARRHRSERSSAALRGIIKRMKKGKT